MKLFFICSIKFSAFSTSYFICPPQIKAIDNGTPQKWSTTRLHVEWIRKPVPSPQALRFTAAVYNFTVTENAKVYESVGVVSVWQTATPLWFDIIGEHQ